MVCLIGYSILIQIAYILQKWSE